MAACIRFNTINAHPRNLGQAQGRYTFFGHLKWAPVILLGYAASILTHMWINSATFRLPPEG